MDLETLVALSERAIDEDPPAAVKELCVDYYRPYYHLMYLVAQETMSGLFIELGTDTARGCGCLATGAPAATVWGIDHTLKPKALAVAEQLSNLILHERPSLPPPDLAGRYVSILHIDTEHSYSMALAEFEAYQGTLAPGAVVLFDDLHAQDDDVLRYFESLPYPKFQDDRLHSTCGYGGLVYVA